MSNLSFHARYHFLPEEDFKKLCLELNLDINDNIIKIESDIFIRFRGDLSDLGNDIGLEIGEYINNDNIGFDRDDFISGLYHGISIIDGTHSLKKINNNNNE